MVPSRLPIRTASLLAGLSEPTFRRHALDAVRDGRGGVSRSALEGYLHREIGAEAYLAALSRLEPRRERERTYKRTSP